MTIQHLKDQLQDLIHTIALEVYEARDDIYSSASEGLLDDDHEQVDMNASDIIMQIVKEKLKD
jgi:hypothetical protein